MDDVSKLHEEIDWLKAQNKDIMNMNEFLAKENDNLDRQNDKMRKALESISKNSCYFNGDERMSEEQKKCKSEHINGTHIVISDKGWIKYFQGEDEVNYFFAKHKLLRRNFLVYELRSLNEAKQNEAHL